MGRNKRAGHAVYSLLGTASSEPRVEPGPSGPEAGWGFAQPEKYSSIIWVAERQLATSAKLSASVFGCAMSIMIA
jgi:hypothetical protein